MRVPRFSTFIRTLTIFSTFTRAQVSARSSTRLRPTGLKSMPSIPFLSSFFSSSESSKMSYPDERTPDEWRAVLNKGTLKPC
jgi:peptide-methionine (R)-S-oxide reductase